MTHLLEIVRKIWDDDYERQWWLLFFYSMIILEFPYRLAVAARNYLYDKEIIRSKKLPCAVISVGNIVVGGTGKTPAVIMLAQLLKEEGFKPAVLSRGYGGNSKKPVNVVSDGVNIFAGCRDVGDEPVLMSQIFSGIPVIAGVGRFAVGEIAIKKFGADVLILDDGFQYRSLYRNIDVVLLDSKRPVGNGHLLPSGSLREPPNSLSRADIVILTGSVAGDKDKQANLPTPLLKDQPNLFYGCHKPLDVRAGSGNGCLSLEYLQGKKVFAFAGIGNPMSFYRSIEGLKALIVGFLAFSDHHAYSRLDIEKISDQARRFQADIILTTEKDGIRLREHSDFFQEIFMLRIELSIISSGDAFRKMILQKLR